VTTTVEVTICAAPLPSTTTRSSPRSGALPHAHVALASNCKPMMRGGSEKAKVAAAAHSSVMKERNAKFMSVELLLSAGGGENLGRESLTFGENTGCDSTPSLKGRIVCVRYLCEVCARSSPTYLNPFIPIAHLLKLLKAHRPPQYRRTRTMPSLLVAFFLFSFHHDARGQAVGDASSYSMYNSINCEGDAVYVWNVMPVCTAEIWSVGSYDFLCNSTGVYRRLFATPNCTGGVDSVRISGYTSCMNAYQPGLPSSFARMSVQWRCGLSSITSTTGAFSTAYYLSQARGNGGGSGACEKTALSGVNYIRADTCALGSKSRRKYFNETHAQVLFFANDDCTGPANRSFLAYGCSFSRLGGSNDPDPFFAGSVAAWIPAVSAAAAETRTTPPWELLSLISLIGIPALFFLCRYTLAWTGAAKTAPAAGSAIHAQPHSEKV
jgi:hypothetical protein